MPEYVYFIGHDEAVKIGYTNNLRSRMSSIQTGNPKPLARLAVITCVNAVEVERRLHKTFEQWRLEGEWFARNPKLNFIINYLSTCAKKAGIEHLDAALKAYEGADKIKPTPMNYDEYFLADTMLMLATDMYYANETANSLQLRYAVSYYRNWLMDLKTLNYKKFRTEYTLRGGKRIPRWNALTDLGYVYECPNYFYSAEFANLKVSEPKAILIPEFEEITESQLQLFKLAS
jgi:hypothetical protein